MLAEVKATYNEFPVKFWVLGLATFIDVLGHTLIFPFFALYVTQRFNVGMTEAGVLLAIFSIMGLVGSMVGGALADKFGRRSVAIFGLVFSALSSLSMGVVGSLPVFYLLAVVVGFLSNIGGPAREAMVADMLPEEKRAEGYGMLRVILNISWILGPTIGGLLAARSFLLLFILDAVASLITAAIVFRMIPETKPEFPEGQPQPSLIETVTGYRVVMRDGLYMLYLVVTMLLLAAYQQIYGTLSVFLRDVHGLSLQANGLLMSLNALTVVATQIWITRRTSRYPPMVMMALGAAFNMVGLAMYGFASTYALFVVAMVIITIAEMIFVPVAQALVARFAPEDMRGRYMAVHALAWTIPSSVAPWAAGMIMDNYDPSWVWYAAGIISFAAILGYSWLHFRTSARFAADAARKQEVLLPS
jgi:MFS family permease